MLASGGNPADKTIRLWDWHALDKAPRVLANQKGATNSLQFEPEKNQLLTTSWNTGLVQLWDLDSPNPLPRDLRMPGLHRPWTSRFSPDGKSIVVTGHKGIFSWERNALDVESSVLLPAPSHMFGIAYTEDGAYLAASGFGPAIFLKDLTDPSTPVSELVGHSPEGSRTVAFSPDGNQLASGGQDGTVRLWNTATPSEPSRILGRHDDAVTRVHFSPDGKQLASASVDQNIRLWDLANQTALPIVLSGFAGQIYGLDYHPAGKHIAAAGHVDNSGSGIKIWDLTLPTNSLPADQLAAFACTKVRRNLTIEEWHKFIGTEIPYRRTCPNLPLHPSLIVSAEKLAKSGDRDAALALLQRAVELDSTLQLDPILQVKEWADSISIN